MDRRIRKHFEQNDQILLSVIQKLGADTGRLTPTVTKDYFIDLCETIINQQLSEKAGATIYNRFFDLISKRKPTPNSIASIPDDKLRAVGMSWSKVRFIKSLAESFIKKEIDFVALERQPDEDVIVELTKLQGIGRWTAEMFLMFSLGRPDVFSHGDVGLRRAIQKLYGFKREPTVREIEKIIKPWSPYKTYACRILWRSLDL